MTRWLQAGLIAGTLIAATVSCLVGPGHALHLDPCYWDVAQLPSRILVAVLRVVAQSIVGVATEVVR